VANDSPNVFREVIPGLRAGDRKSSVTISGRGLSDGPTATMKTGVLQLQV